MSDSSKWGTAAKKDWKSGKSQAASDGDDWRWRQKCPPQETADRIKDAESTPNSEAGSPAMEAQTGTQSEGSEESDEEYVTGTA